jgi:hypothetical protein
LPSFWRLTIRMLRTRSAPGAKVDLGGILTVIRNLQDATRAADAEHVVWANRAFVEVRRPALVYRYSRYAQADSPHHAPLLLRSIGAVNSLIGERHCLTRTHADTNRRFVRSCSNMEWKHKSSFVEQPRRWLTACAKPAGSCFPPPMPCSLALIEATALGCLPWRPTAAGTWTLCDPERPACCVNPKSQPISLLSSARSSNPMSTCSRQQVRASVRSRSAPQSRSNTCRHTNSSRVATPLEKA